MLSAKLRSESLLAVSGSSAMLLHQRKQQMQSPMAMKHFQRGMQMTNKLLHRALLERPRGRGLPKAAQARESLALSGQPRSHELCPALLQEQPHCQRRHQAHGKQLADEPPLRKRLQLMQASQSEKSALSAAGDNVGQNNERELQACLGRHACVCSHRHRNQQQVQRLCAEGCK